MTNLPAPDNKGKPCSSLPKFGTYASGVVIRNESVTSDIPKVSTPPTSPILGNQIPSKVKNPITTIAVPSA